MRASETERLKALRQKQATGKELSEKELSRLSQLEEIERRDLENGRGISQSGNNLGTSGDGLGKGESIEQGKRNKLDPGTEKPSTNTNGSDRDTISEDREIDNARGNDRSANDSNGSDRGFNDCEEYGRDRGDQRGIDGDTDGDTDGETNEEKEVSRKSSVLTQAPKKEVKPRTKKTSTKATSPIVSNDLDFIAIVLQSGFSMIASVTQREHWNIAEDEAKSVSVPLTKMFDSLDKVQKKKFEKYINPIMLGSAVAGIVVPRIMIDMAIVKGEKEYAKQRQMQGSIIGTVNANDPGDHQAGEQSGNTYRNETVNSDPNTIIAGLFK